MNNMILILMSCNTDKEKPQTPHKQPPTPHKHHTDLSPALREPLAPYWCSTHQGSRTPPPVGEV